MTTFDAQGRITSQFIPPTDADGKVMSHREWLAADVVHRLRHGETREDIEASLARALGTSIIWHGNSDVYAESVRVAIGALRKECGVAISPASRTT